MTPRDAEIARYVALYAAKGAAYTTTARRLALWRALLDERPDLRAAGLLDVGAGHGRMLAEAGRAGYSGRAGVEVVPTLARGPIAIAPAWALPFADMSRGTVASFDVFEHLLPEDVPASLAEMARVASRRILLLVSCVPSMTTDERGGLHMTIWEPARWLDAARAAWEPRGFIVRARDDKPTDALFEGIRS